MTTSQFVICSSTDKSPIEIPIDQLRQRPAAYGIIVHEEQALVVRSNFQDKLLVPGGGIHVGEPTVDAVRREIMEETGIQAKVDQFLCFDESFFYFPRSGNAYHGFNLYYACTPLTFDLAKIDEIQDDFVIETLWIPVDNLEPDHFLGNGILITKLYAQVAGIKDR